MECTNNTRARNQWRKEKKETMISRMAVGETPSPSLDCLNFLIAMDPFLFLVLARNTSPYVPSPTLPTSSYIWSHAGLWEPPPPPRPSPIPAVSSWLLLCSLPVSLSLRFGRGLLGRILQGSLLFLVIKFTINLLHLEGLTCKGLIVWITHFSINL